MRQKTKPDRITTAVRIDKDIFESLKKRQGQMSDIINKAVRIAYGQELLCCPECKTKASIRAMGVRI